MIKRKISRKELKVKDYLVWNAFIDLISKEEESNLTKIQQIGKRVFDYDSEILNGGHMQYFENTRLSDYNQIIDSLTKMNAIKQANILHRADEKRKSQERPIIKNKKHYSEIALEGEFDKLDNEYYRLIPTLTDLMKQYVINNTNEFVEFID